jgi:superfamily II DNA or RNA helicase
MLDYVSSPVVRDGLFAPLTAEPIAAMVPRDYQEDDHDESFRLWDSGVIGTLTRAATGCGKTFMACMKIKTWLGRGPNYRSMIVSYERNLVWQFAQEVEEFLGIVPGIEMGDDLIACESIPKVIVASRQSLLVADPPTPAIIAELFELGIKYLGSAPLRVCERFLRFLKKGGDADRVEDEVSRLNSMPEATGGTWSRLHKFDRNMNWLVIFDEAHRHAYSMKSVGHIVDWFDANTVSRRNGLTATPKRSDKINIGYKMFPGIAIDYPLFHATNRCAVKDGWAVPYVQRYIEVEGVDFKNVARIKGDFDEADLERILGEEGTLAKLVQPLLDMVGDRRTLIFSPGVAMAKNVARFINARSETECPECHLVAWHPTKLIGDGAQCRCGVLLAAENVTKSGDQARELDGQSSEHDRKTTYKAHQSGRFQFLSVCGLCVAKGTLVLTDQGEIPIERVTPQMLLWDGVEWVSHDGVVFNGEKNVVKYAGITATGDHNVWTDSGWMRLAACKQQGLAIRVSGIGGEAVRESCGYYRDDHSAWQEPASRIRGSLPRLRSDQRESVQRNEARKLGLSALRQKQRRPELATDAMPLSKEAVRKSERRILPGLRRTGYQVLLRCACRDGSLDQGKYRAVQRDDSGPQGQQPSLRTRQHSLGQSDGTSEQQATTPPRLQEEVEVYDILNSGPRHRFTANGLIVSNCREGYNDPDISCVAVFRPVSKEASGLAEQLKGRACRPLRSLVPTLNGLKVAESRVEAIEESDKPNALIVDLVGITGLADCASTVQIYAEGLDDEVIALAEKIVEESADDEVNIEEAVDQAQEQEKIKAEREERERRANHEASERARLNAEVNYTTHEIGVGGGKSEPGGATEGQVKYMRYLGMNVKVSVTAKQARRIIDMLKDGTKFSDVAYKNRLKDGQWEWFPPTEKQIWKLGSCGISAKGVGSGYDASQMIDAKCNSREYVAKKLQAIRDCRRGDELSVLASELSIVRSILSPGDYRTLVDAGSAKRKSMGSF